MVGIGFIFAFVLAILASISAYFIPNHAATAATVGLGLLAVIFAITYASDRKIKKTWKG